MSYNREELNKLKKDFKGLSLPFFPISFLNVKKFNRKNELLLDKNQKANSWLKSFYMNISRALFYNGNAVPMFGFTTAERVNTGNPSSLVDTTVEGVWSNLQQYRNLLIKIGSGTTPNTSDTLQIETPIPTNIFNYESQFKHQSTYLATYDEENNKFIRKIWKKFLNKNDTPLIINEIGLDLVNKNYNSYTVCERTVLSEPITLNEFDSVEIEYTIEMPWLEQPVVTP